MNTIPLRLYVHIPFCKHKCHYCDFNSVVCQTPPWRDYARALLDELAHWSQQPRCAGRRLASIFFGGGTPSLAPAGLIADVINAAAGLFGLEPEAEISLEANPGSSDAARFAAYRQAGVNRLSLGVQSLEDRSLQWLERVHDARAARDAFAMARRAGFANINLDLMYGLPGQSLAAWLQQLETIVGWDAEHLSCYQLTVEPGTRLAGRHARNPLPLPDEDAALAFFTATHQMLANAGYRRYEISNYSKADLHCRHNSGYWRYDDYIGIGAGAAGKLDLADGGVWRYKNRASFASYMAAVGRHGSAVAEEERLAVCDAAAEAVWLGLRTSQGIDRRDFRRRFGRDPWLFFAPQLSPWLEGGQLSLTHTSLRPSAGGMALADAVAASVV